MMETAAILHRPDSEYAYLYEADNFHIRLRTKKDEVSQVGLIGGDPYLFDVDEWYKNEEPMKLIASTDVHDYWLIETTAPYRRLQYAFHVVGKDGTEVFYGDRGIFPYTAETLATPGYFFRMPYFQEIDRFKSPDWVKETVWYQIFPERFANGNPAITPKNALPWGSKEHPGREDFFGGDLQGVIDHLDYLVDLGINGIYFCPIFKASSNHKYDTIDYYEIDPDFGDKETFKKLVDEAHKRGIRIMLDAVFNHTGDSSPLWQDVVKNQEKSKYVDWFHVHSFPVDIGKNGNFEGERTVSYDTFAFTPHMPKLNTANPEVQKYLLDIATYWIREFDIDAWRLDVANEVDHHFWKEFFKATTDLKKDFYILGEIWHSSQSWLQGDEFHAVMNYAYTETIEDFFVKKKIDVSKMVAGLNEQLMLYRQQTNEVQFNMLDSHDTARLLTICGDDKELAKATLAFTFLQHGSPCIYYGTEIGMTGDNDPDCRKCMIWDQEKQDLTMFDFTKKLISLRKEKQEVLSYGSLEWSLVADQEKCVGFKRVGQNEVLTCYFNQGNQETTIDKIEAEEVLLSNLTTSNPTSITIEPNGFIILSSKI